MRLAKLRGPRKRYHISVLRELHGKDAPHKWVSVVVRAHDTRQLQFSYYSATYYKPQRVGAGISRLVKCCTTASLGR